MYFLQAFQSHFPFAPLSFQFATDLLAIHFWVFSMSDTAASRKAKHDCLVSLLVICSLFPESSQIEVPSSPSDQV